MAEAPDRTIESIMLTIEDGVYGALKWAPDDHVLTHLAELDEDAMARFTEVITARLCAAIVVSVARLCMRDPANQELVMKLDIDPEALTPDDLFALMSAGFNDDTESKGV